MSLDFWNTRYATVDYVFGTAPNAFLASQASRLQPGWRVLAVADGEGRNGVWLAQQGRVVHAVDGSPVALEKAARLAAAHGVTLQTETVDLLNWDWPLAAYDCVVAIFIQFAPPGQRERLIDGIWRSLKPGGLVLLQGYTPEQVSYGTGGPSDPANMYTEADLRRWFGDWNIIELRTHVSQIDEGAGHRGLSALIDLVAIRPRV